MMTIKTYRILRGTSYLCGAGTDEEEEFDSEEDDLSKLWSSAYLDRGLFERKYRI
jgi:hypothetical protein